MKYDIKVPIRLGSREEPGHHTALTSCNLMVVKECELVFELYLMTLVPLIECPISMTQLKPYFLMPQSHLGLKCNICILGDTNIPSIMASPRKG